MTEPIAFKTFDSSGDLASFGPMVPGSCALLANVWVGALNLGDYAFILLEYPNGQGVFVTKKKPKPDRHWSFNCAGDIRPGPLLPSVPMNRAEFNRLYLGDWK